MNTSAFRLGWGAMIGFAVACGLCGAAPAQEPTNSRDGPNAMTGTWEFSNADHDKICRFTFRAEARPAVTGSKSIGIAQTCFHRPRMSSAGRSTASARSDCSKCPGNAIIEFTKAEDGIFDGFQPGEGRYVCRAPPQRRSIPPKTWLAIGRWRGEPASRFAF